MFAKFDKTEPFIPLAGSADDGWSTEDQATATCYCGAVQLAFVSVSLVFVVFFFFVLLLLLLLLLLFLLFLFYLTLMSRTILSQHMVLDLLTHLYATAQTAIKSPHLCLQPILSLQTRI